MSWFKKPVAYRSYSDGTYEIIERRSFLRIGAAVLAVAATPTGGAFIYPKLTEKPGESLGPPPALVAIDIIARQDRATVYQVLTQYERLERIGRTDFWMAVAALQMTDLIPFAEYQARVESDQAVRDAIAQSISSLDALDGAERR